MYTIKQPGFIKNELTSKLKGYNENEIYLFATYAYTFYIYILTYYLSLMN